MGNKMSDGTQSIERATSILRVLATRSRFGWGLTDLSNACGLKKATTRRILARLEKEGLVFRREEGARYFLGSLLGELSMSVHGFHRFVAEAQESVTELSRSLSLVAILSIRSGDHFVVGARVATSRIKGELNEVGARRPLISTAGGIAILAALPEEEQETIGNANLALLSRPGKARLDPYSAMWVRAKARGYGTNLGDIAPGVNAVAVAAINSLGRPIASVTLAGPEGQLSIAKCEALVPTISHECSRIIKMASQVHPSLYEQPVTPN